MRNFSWILFLIILWLIALGFISFNWIVLFMLFFHASINVLMLLFDLTIIKEQNSFNLSNENFNKIYGVKDG